MNSCTNSTTNISTKSTNNTNSSNKSTFSLKIGVFNVDDYPIWDQDELNSHIEHFDRENAATLDPKQNNQLRERCIRRSELDAKAQKVYQRYKSLQADLLIRVNSDYFQDQVNAFKALGITNVTPVGFGYNRLNECMVVATSCVSNFTYAEKYTSCLNHLSPIYKEQHQQINFDLAMQYNEKARSLPKSDVVTDFTHMNIRADYTEDCADYHEAFCIYHLAVASELGHAKSSFLLAQICAEGKFLLPKDWKYERRAKALEYASKAEKQAVEQKDWATLFSLGEYYGNFGYQEDKSRCQNTAMEFGYKPSSGDCVSNKF